MRGDLRGGYVRERQNIEATKYYVEMYVSLEPGGVIALHPAYRRAAQWKRSTESVGCLLEAY
jgi:hypothetical protein